MINKGEWSIPIGLPVFEPRVKSEIRSDRPFNALLEEVVLAEQTLFLLWTQPLMAESVGVAYFPRYGRQMFNTQLQVGLELSRLSLLEGQSETVREGSKSWTLVSQLTNRVGYLGVLACFASRTAPWKSTSQTVGMTSARVSFS